MSAALPQPNLPHGALPQVVVAESIAPQAWKNGGGQTRELLAWPLGGDWKMRVSRADIASDGPFSAFPGVERWFVVLEGAGVRLHFPDTDHDLRVGDAPLRFDGALAPGCSQIEGATQDLNLMVRDGHGGMMPVQAGALWPPAWAINGLYARVAGLWQCHHADGREQSLALPAHSLLWTQAGTDPCDAQHWQFSPTHSGTGADLAAGWWIGYRPAMRDVPPGTPGSTDPTGSTP